MLNLFKNSFDRRIKYNNKKTELKKKFESFCLDQTSHLSVSELQDLNYILEKSKVVECSTVFSLPIVLFVGSGFITAICLILVGVVCSVSGPDSIFIAIIVGTFLAFIAIWIISCLWKVLQHYIVSTALDIRFFDRY